MGGTDADRSGITARPKPPLPPKPPLVTKQNGIIHSPTHSFSGILSTDEETVIQDSGTVMKEKETKENGIHDVKIDSVLDSIESNIFSSGVTVHNMERSIPQAELSSVNNTLPPLNMSAASSDRTNTRTVTRGRPSRRASRHSTENGESGDEACCIRFAGMLRTKAVDMASKSKILPPAKPPKPDSLVKYKGRRRKGSQQNDMPCQRSVGDDFSIDGSRHGVRFVDDDETESSTDYKDFDENSVFLLELACHCDAQNISKGTGILTEGVESGYYTSDVVKTDEEANVSDSCQPVDKKDSVHETDKQIMISPIPEQMKTAEEESFPQLVEEKAKIVSCQETGSQVIDSENSILTADAGHAISFEGPPDSENFSDSLISSTMILEQKSEEKNNSDICVETIVNKDHEPSPVILSALVTDSTYTETKEIAPEIVKESIQKPKRVKSPPRPPPPQIVKKQPQPIIEAEQIVNKCVITKDELNSDGETATEETKKEESTFAQTLVNSMPVEETILVPEVPQTKKRVTSPPRPPPPKIKEIVLDTKEIMPLSVEKVDDKINHTEQTDDSPNKKQPPPIPTKPERKRKERLHEKSSLEPLDLSTRDDISQCTKPLSLSPKTFPRSGKQGTRPSQVKKMELKPREQTESKGKPVMTTVVRNTYLEGLQPLPLLKSSSENKLLPTRPPPPILTKTEETNSSSNVDSAVEQNACLLLETSGDISETSKSVDGINTVPSIQNNIVECKENLNVIKDDVIECKENLNEVKDQSLDECLVNAIIDSSIDIQEDHSPVTDTSLQDTKIDDKLETIATQNAFVRDEIQSSTWPTAAERKKRKEMKSPPRPPPPNRDAIMETFSRQTYETSSLDSRGRKRIKSPPRPSPPSRGKLPLKIEEELASSSVSQSEEKTNITDSNDKNTAKRIKSPPRPPPPVYEKLPLKRIIAEQYQINLTNEAEKLPSDTNSTLLAKSSSETHQSENDLPKITKEHVAHVPLATEETVADEIDLASSSENKKRVISPPRPPPPVYEKLSLRRTDKPIIPSLTTPRRKKPSETSDSQKQFMSLQRPSDVSGHWNSNQFSPNTNVLHEYEEIHPPNEESLDSQKKRPKAPPRIKRNRSRTVEVVAVTPKPEERKRRSHSLTESDVSKKLEDRGLLCTPQQSEIKKLYTTVQKEHGKTKLQEVDINEDSRTTPGYDKMKLRPLPPPPPPPRCRSRSSMSQSPGSTCLNTSVSEEVKLDVTPENASYRTNQIVKQIDFPEYDENANISFPSKTEEQKKDETSHNKVTTDKCSDEKITHGLENQSDKSNVTHRKSHSPSSTRSKSPSPSKHRSCSSWYDESDVSGDLGDVDTSSSIKGSAEGINKDESESTMLKQKHVKTKTEQSRTSTFYCDLEDDAFHDCSSELPQVETERPLSSSSLVEKSVQTSPERELALRSQEKNDHSDDTDDLLDHARTVQMELCLMLERRKRRKGQSHGGEDDTKSSCSYTPSPKSTIPRSKVKIVSNPPESDSFANIESPLTVSPVDGRCQLPSTRSSNSELGWQVLSSDESDEDSGELSPTLQKKKQKKAFQIANEIMTSEETFIKSLKLLNEDFREAVEKANKERGGTVISEEAVNSFLKYFPQLQNLNENLLGELKERIEHWEETGKIADVIVKIGPFLKLYCSYIRDFDAMEAALDDARRKYPLFDQVTKEFESGPLCKLALKHYMLRPIQRIPLYRLLLQRYLHNLTPDSPDYNDTVTALEIVSDVAERANKTLRQGDDFRKLISIQNSLFGQHEVIRPGRVFLKEGELMKLSRKEMQPRWFILFNDSLLYLTSMQQGLFKVNNELPLAGMKVHIPQQQDYQNEFSIISVTRSFTLAARSLEERQEWIDALNEAIEENASKRNTFANVMIQQKRREEQVDGGFTLGKQAPVWIPDARVTMCQLCTSEFTITFRRHHCRACGKVVCSLCSANQAPLQYRNFNVARVCDECFKKLHEEFEAADPIEKITEESGSCSEVIETDSDSPYAMASIKAQFKGNAKNAGKKNKRQLPSVLKEVCANDQGSTLSGYLYRRHRKYWKRFWFVLKDKVLYTYKASEDVAALESVPLLGFRVEVFTKPFEGVEAELLFQLTHPGQFPIVFHADTIGSTERWVQAMQHATILE